MYTYRILQNWREDTFHSSILTFEKNSYLFNCCDGTQRNALDQGVKFSKIKSIFFNSSSSECYLGTFGLIMSRGEQVFSQVSSQKNTNTISNKNDLNETFYSKKNKINKDKNLCFPKQAELYGPPMFTSNFQHSSFFCPAPIIRNVFELNYANHSFINLSNSNTTPIFKDKNITVFPICINKGDLSIKNDYTMSYIIIPAQKAPPFLPEKAKQLGLKPGPLFGKLQKGESVVSENGNEIKPEMVLGPVEPSSSLCILYIPSIEYMKDLLVNQIIGDYLKDNTIKYTNTITIHIVPKLEIINNDEYIKFMNLFGKETLHIIDCKETNRKFMYNEGKMQIKSLLNKVDSCLFSNAKFSYEDTLPLIHLNTLSNKTTEIKITESIPGFELCLYPVNKNYIINKGLYDNEPYYFKSELYTNFNKQIDVLIKNIHEDVKKSVIPVDHMSSSNTLPRITFLGTTSMKPCKFRNVTSIMIHLPSNKYALLDCGEGTYQQIFEHYGKSRTNEILSKIKLIAITHKHGDHMLGLIKMLLEIDKQISLDQEKCFIIVPKTIIEFVNQSINADMTNKALFHVVESSNCNPNQAYVYDKFLAQNNPHEGFEDIKKEKDYSQTQARINTFIQSPSIKQLYSEFKSILGINIFSIEVFHCDESFGYFIESTVNNDSSYFKISFSGDTRPNNNFFNYSMNSSVLIHEGTFDDELVIDAKEKMHSTIGEAIALGKENNSKRIIITHFSPRYIKCYPYKELFHNEQILLSHDYLSFSLDDLNWAFEYLKPFDTIINTIEKNDLNIL